MNYAQFILFFLYLLSLFLSGVGIYSIFNKAEIRFNKIVCLGEVLLLGSISLVGQLFVLSILHLYKNPYLWGVVFLNYTFILNSSAKRLIRELFKFNFRLNIPLVIFTALAGILIFRNLYFLADVDSHSTYLFTQKLWLTNGTSLVGDSTYDLRIFVPQFDAVPYSLGISIFGKETLFPQMVNLLWRLISLLLVFGYTKYRLNSYYALAAGAFIIFNDHFFYSGANQCVIINAAIIALIFAAAYNFWEARLKNDTCRFVLATVFLSQLPANKYYLVICCLFLFIFGFAIQPKPVAMIKDIVKVKKYLYIMVFAFFLTALWYIKNFIVTGDPAFPLFAGKLRVFYWTSEQIKVFGQLVGHINPYKIIKYSSFLFIWPGVNPAKYVLISILILPFVICFSILKNRANMEEIIELCFWLGMSLAALFGLCFVTWLDPRFYRFLIGIFAFCAVLSLRFIIKSFFNIKNEIIPVAIVLCISFQGCSVVNKGGVVDSRPTLKENIDVALNKIHMDYIVRKHQPGVILALEVLDKNKDKLNSSAWFTDDFTSAFLIPDRPRISLLCTTTIKWDSYSRENLIISDLQHNGIKWVMEWKEKNLVFIPIEEFAREAVKFDRSPKKTLWDYGFPEEMTRIN